MTDEVGVAEVEGWAAGLAELHARIAPRFARSEPRERGEFDDSILVTAQVATTSADLLDSVADRAEREYLDTDGSDDQRAAAAAVCAGLRTSIDDLRQATRAP